MSITQTLGSAWQQNGVSFSQWNAMLTVTGSQPVTAVTISAPGETFTQLWGLTANGNDLYSLPSYVTSLGPGQSQQFGYIWQSSNSATFNVLSVTCGGQSPAASPSSIPSASPVPSPSASASPTIVNTPQPSPCSVSFQFSARPASQGGSWTQGNTFFQIYDLTFTNTGRQPATSILFTLDFASDQSISQSWNINSLGGDLYQVTNQFGPLQVGANIMTGFVLSQPISSSSGAPRVAISSVTCSGSVASPSASPTIVNTPRPSSSPAAGCSATVNLVARPASQGGVWMENGSTFQIFDATVFNNGQRPLNGGVITFNLGPNETVTQYWNLSPGTANGEFNIAFLYGPLQPNSSLGTGIVVSVPGSTPPDSNLTFNLSGLSCQ